MQGGFEGIGATLKVLVEMRTQLPQLEAVLLCLKAKAYRSRLMQPALPRKIVMVAEETHSTKEYLTHGHHYLLPRSRLIA